MHHWPTHVLRHAAPGHEVKRTRIIPSAARSYLGQVALKHRAPPTGFEVGLLRQYAHGQTPAGCRCSRRRGQWAQCRHTARPHWLWYRQRRCIHCWSSAVPGPVRTHKSTVRRQQKHHKQGQQRASDFFSTGTTLSSCQCAHGTRSPEI